MESMSPCGVRWITRGTEKYTNWPWPTHQPHPSVLRSLLKTLMPYRQTRCQGKWRHAEQREKLFHVFLLIVEAMYRWTWVDDPQVICRTSEIVWHNAFEGGAVDQSMHCGTRKPLQGTPQRKMLEYEHYNWLQRDDNSRSCHDFAKAVPYNGMSFNFKSFQAGHHSIWNIGSLNSDLPIWKGYGVHFGPHVLLVEGDGYDSKTNWFFEEHNLMDVHCHLQQKQ